MEKKIVETKASYPGVPRVDFLYPDFDALVDNKGYEVIWERAIPCPCSKRVQHQSTCRNCGGSGWVFINPTRIKAVCQSLNKNTRYKDWSVEMLGTAAITVKSMFHLNFMDKIMIEQRHVDSVRKYLGEENLRYFRHLKGLKGEVFPVLKLNYRKKGVTAHPVGLREGMKIRNWMRVNFPEFTQLSQNKIEKLSEELINKAIIFE